MASIVLKYVTNRLLKDNQLNRLWVEDPYYEQVPIGEKNGKIQYKKTPRRIPDKISVNDTQVLKKFKRRAFRYDMWFTFCGVKFGWTNIVGLVPIFGALVSAYWSLNLLVLARTLDDGLPLDLQLLFLFNILVDFLLGLIPIVGDIVEVGYKSNSRNYLLLEKHLERVSQKNLGLISKEEVRPGFINDKVEPVFEQKIMPSALKAGESLKHLVHSAGSSKSFSSDSSFRPSSGSATIQTSPTTATKSARTDGEDISSGAKANLAGLKYAT